MTSNELPVTWDVARLSRPQATFPAPDFSAPEVRALFYESVPYRGRPTRVFAWLGLPEAKTGESCPAMVNAAAEAERPSMSGYGSGTAAGRGAGMVVGCARMHATQKPVDDRHEHGAACWDTSFDQTGGRLRSLTYYVVAPPGRVIPHRPAAAADRSASRISWGGYLTCGVATRSAARLRVRFPRGGSERQYLPHSAS